MFHWELHLIELTSVIVTYEPEVGIVQDGSIITRFHGIVRWMSQIYIFYIFSYTLSTLSKCILFFEYIYSFIYYRKKENFKYHFLNISFYSLKLSNYEIRMFVNKCKKKKYFSNYYGIINISSLIFVI